MTADGPISRRGPGDSPDYPPVMRAIGALCLASFAASTWPAVDRLVELLLAAIAGSALPRLVIDRTRGAVRAVRVATQREHGRRAAR